MRRDTARDVETRDHMGVSEGIREQNQPIGTCNHQTVWRRQGEGARRGARSAIDCTSRRGILRRPACRAARALVRLDQLDVAGGLGKGCGPRRCRRLRAGAARSIDRGANPLKKADDDGRGIQLLDTSALDSPALCAGAASTAVTRIHHVGRLVETGAAAAVRARAYVAHASAFRPPLVW